MNQYFTPLAYFCYHYIFENKFHSPYLIFLLLKYIFKNIRIIEMLMAIFRLIKICCIFLNYL